MNRTDFRSILTPDFSEASATPVAETGRELQELISPISIEEFVGSYFARKSLSLPGTPHKFDHLFSCEKLKQAVARGQAITDRRYNIMGFLQTLSDNGIIEVAD